MRKIAALAIGCALLAPVVQAHEVPCRETVSHGYVKRDCWLRNAYRRWHAEAERCRHIRVWNEHDRQLDTACR